METQQALENQIVKEVEEKHRQSLYLAKYSATGAMIACMLATFTVIEYLLATVIKYLYIENGNLMSYVFGSNYGMEDIASESLFVVIARFIIVFGLSWLPITTIIAWVRARKQ
ncbi:MAG: hypothetical protein ABFD05_06815 [Anaerolineaceae bacterium]